MEVIKEKSDPYAQKGKEFLVEKVQDSEVGKTFKNTANEVQSKVDDIVKINGASEVFTFLKELCQNIKGTVITQLSREEIMKSSYAIFVNKYRQEGAISKYFYSFDLTRQLIISIILVAGEGDGYGKAIAITVFNFLYLFSVILIRPYVEKKLLIETIFTETIYSICSILVCALAKTDDLSTKENIGMAIVVFNGILTYLIMIIQAKEGIFGTLCSIYKTCRGDSSVTPS